VVLTGASGELMVAAIPGDGADPQRTEHHAVSGGIEVQPLGNVEAVANAPAAGAGYFKVPLVIER